MRFGSVCSGIEAASLAFGAHGWEAAWFSEIEPFPCAVLAHHYPHVENLGDMRAIAALVRQGLIEPPQALVGGTPCQAFSVAGNRESLNDDRGNLSLTFCDIADAIDEARARDGLQPSVVFWENVPGVLSTKDNAFGCFLGQLAGEDCALVPAGRKWTNAGVVLGPRRAVAWRILDAQYFGLAQRRRRVFVVASARDGFDPAAVLLEFEGVRRDSPPRRGQAEDAAGTLAGGARKRGGFSYDDVPAVATLDASFGRLQGASGQDANHGHSHLVLAFGGNNTSGSIDAATALNAHGGSGRMDFESETFITQAVAFQSSQSGVRIGDVHATLDSNNGSRRHNGAIQGMRVRRLMPIEAERLQGFPDGHTAITVRGKPAADGPRYKALGNSWAVSCVRWIANRVTTEFLLS